MPLQLKILIFDIDCEHILILFCNFVFCIKGLCAQNVGFKQQEPLSSTSNKAKHPVRSILFPRLYEIKELFFLS